MDVAEKPQAPSAPRWSDEQIRAMVAKGQLWSGRIGRGAQGAPLSVGFVEYTALFLLWQALCGFLITPCEPVFGDYLGVAFGAMAVAGFPIAWLVGSLRTKSNRRLVERLLREGQARPVRVAKIGEGHYGLYWDSSWPNLDVFRVWCKPEDMPLVEAASVLTLGASRRPCCVVLGDQVTLRRGWP